MTSNTQHRSGLGGGALPKSMLTGEELLSLTELAKVMPKINGRRPAVTTLWRWCLEGVAGVHLEHIRRGRTIATSLEAVGRFSMQLAEARLEQMRQRRELVLPLPSRPRVGRSASARRRRIEEASRRLEQAGI